MRIRGLTDPISTDLWTVLHAVADELGLAEPRVAWFLRGAFHFKVPGEEGLTIAISPESAGRIRVDRCQATVVHASMWAREDDLPRLREIVRETSVVRA